MKPAIREMPRVWRAAFEHNGVALQHLSVTCRTNATIVKVAVANNGYALEYAGERQRDNRDVVLTAVQQNGRALQYASARLRDDIDVASAAIQNNVYAYEHMGETAQTFIEAIITAASLNRGMRCYARGTHYSGLSRWLFSREGLRELVFKVVKMKDE